MICRWCRNDNILADRICVHCHERLVDDRWDEIEVSPVPPEDGEGADLEPWKSFGVAVVAFAVLTGGGWLTFDAWPRTAPVGSPPAGASSPAESPPVPDAATQLNEMHALLLQINATRAKLPPGLGGCGSRADDLDPLLELTEERRQQNVVATDLTLDAVPDGTALQDALMDLTQETLEADEEYIEWAQGQSVFDCTDARTRPSIVTANEEATDAKRRFAAQWNVAARQHGLPTYKWDDF